MPELKGQVLPGHPALNCEGCFFSHEKTINPLMAGCTHKAESRKPRNPNQNCSARESHDEHVAKGPQK